MLDVAIIGGGVCGLALAHSLQARRLDWGLFEARERLGGRVLSHTAGNGAVLDLGPTWYWPGHQPSITRLVADLGLPSFEQPDDGRVLHLHDPNRAPDTVAVHTGEHGELATTGSPQAGAVHGGARRLAGGMAALVNALAQPLPPSRLRLGCALEAVVDHGDRVTLHLRQGGQALTLDARRVVLALPPRVAEAQLRFAPALAPDLQEALRATPTWMATAAKAALACAQPWWRQAGHSGNAWVSHPQAMLAEVFEASTPGLAPGQGAALAGFVALNAAARQQFKGGMDLLLRSQFGQLFGPEVEDGELVTHDWATEPLTAAPLDLQDDAQAPGGHPSYGHPLLQQAHWQGRLLLGGAETARQGGGYLEGALSAAARLRRELLAVPPPQSAAATQAAQVIAAAAAGTAHPPKPLQAEQADATPAPTAWADWADWVGQQRSQALQRYRSRLNLALSQQDTEQLTQRAVLGALESLYADALAQLLQAPPPELAQPAPAALRPADEVPGRAPWTPLVLAPFKGLADELLAEAVKFNNTSCALSNFPYEHRPPRDYLATIRRDLAAAWQDFARAANAQLLALTSPALAPAVAPAAGA